MENFYGLWVSKNEDINKILDTGIWTNKLSNKGRIKGQLQSLSINAKVFIYQGVDDLEIINTPFVNFTSDEKKLNGKIVKVKSIAIGRVKSIDFENHSIEINFENQFISNEWYGYFRQDGIWDFILTNSNNVKQKKYKALYNIVFENEQQDYRWWIDQGLLDPRNSKNDEYTISEEQEELFYKLAEENDLLSRKPQMLGGRTYYQIYPNKSPIKEKTGGTHYEFGVSKNKLFMVLHIESKVANIKEIKKTLNLNSGKSLNKIDVTDLIDEDIRKEFEKMIGLYEKKINQFYQEISYHKEDELHSNTKIQPLNQILYGPPGTGKTYNTINKSLEILGVETLGRNRKELTDEFKRYKENGQIEFVTFHQSYGYEEFVEGIKAETKEGEISYDVENGVFKKLSKKAEQNYIKSKVNLPIKKDFETIFQERILSKIIDDEKFKIATTKKYFYITEVNERTIFFEKADGQTNHSLSIKSLKEMYETGKNEKIKGGLSVYYQPILNMLLENSLFSENEKESLKNHILIIDEINRGNISKIFGELITLIEPSKRIGEEEEILLKLPNSGDNFGVPSNLYIIGTMNTADRSIAQIDTALRRRFLFEEMMPKPALLKSIVIEDTDINVSEILTAINERIEYIYDREHTLGHSYLMPLINAPTKEKLDEIFRVNIIPLLAEYFYGDWEDIIFVLNNDFIKEKRQSKYVQNSSSNRTLNKVYEINEIFGVSKYIKIYDGVSDINVVENKLEDSE